MRISDCLVLANLVSANLLNKEAEIKRETGFGQVNVYLAIHEKDRCINSNLSFLESRILSASIIVIDGNGRTYFFRAPFDLHYDISYYAFNHIEKVRCEDEWAEITIGRGNYDDDNLLFNQSNKLFKLAFGNLDSADETGKIICKRR
jgi:hypothetical protein